MSQTTTTTTRAPAPGQQTITAENVIRLFPDVDPSLASSHRTESANDDLEGYDAEQIRLMDEMCIVLDENDVPIGSASKKVCHKMTNISRGLLHRAFSIFLFDPTNTLLLQKRAPEKITFPSLWTNTCCSHPLGVPGETGATLPDAIAGVKRAAQRKLNHELGIKAEEIPVSEMTFLTRIHYLAPSGGDGVWGEHEIDYILFIRPSSPVTLSPNANEVCDTRYVAQEELKSMFMDPAYAFTPWFKLICETMLFEWWSALTSGTLGKFEGEEGIRRMV